VARGKQGPVDFPNKNIDFDHDIFPYKNREIVCGIALHVCAHVDLTSINACKVRIAVW
jgi:hypothetical protein